MKRTISKLFSALAASLAVAVVMCSLALYKYPYTVRYMIAKVVPSVHVSYTAEDLYYLDTFNDKQSRQMRAAKSAGLKAVPSTREEALGMMDQLEKVESCRAYSLAPMGHSMPYLRPNAKAALDQIGSAFRDSLKARSLPEHKIVVTSILRTEADVKRLQKSNSNAVSNSCHSYGTTFDISYTSFERVGKGKSIASEELKKILAEVLKEQKKSGSIYVKHEVSQPCFHITSRK